MARLAVVLASVEFFIDMCKRGERRVRVVRNAIPDDATFVRAGYDETGMIRIVVQSESFPDVQQGAVLTVLAPPVFEEIDGSSA